LGGEDFGKDSIVGLSYCKVDGFLFIFDEVKPNFAT
jgi:hypothetical protein